MLAISVYSFIDSLFRYIYTPRKRKIPIEFNTSEQEVQEYTYLVLR